MNLKEQYLASHRKWVDAVDDHLRAQVAIFGAGDSPVEGSMTAMDMAVSVAAGAPLDAARRSTAAMHAEREAFLEMTEAQSQWMRTEGKVHGMDLAFSQGPLELLQELLRESREKREEEEQ